MQIENCPICGSDNVDLTQEFSHSAVMVMCEDCGLTLYRDTAREALEAWNTRRQGGKKRVKIEQVAGLRHCPMCGSEAVMRKNASKRFQIKCKRCSCATMWTDKTGAVVSWYNNAELYEQQKGGKAHDVSREDTSGEDKA